LIIEKCINVLKENEMDINGLEECYL